MTSALALTVSGAGGLGLVAAGYESADALETELAVTRELTIGRSASRVVPAAPADREVLSR